MSDDIINTNSVGPSETTQQEQKTNNAIHNEQGKKEQKKEKDEKERLRKKVEDNINSGQANTC
jgi:hypothetical protein